MQLGGLAVLFYAAFYGGWAWVAIISINNVAVRLSVMNSSEGEISFNYVNYDSILCICNVGKLSGTV